ncbi:helix-turn-helix transcriptional regulator [Glaciimonas sp. PAMC28666]|uniref:helix-turn-helix domain-containing protein n=1 Tax=Glaciimonas sp. PAMC28666 TaxID=2807626 RepID=UPI00196369DA|nr:helix-turn-helix transcriptional regulator [Glaciimonas sp. PAMC28666]QRX82239.1 helix-turn-helix transcriptional regulator [Glaciimonas sp. PAMC28666]
METYIPHEVVTLMVDNDWRPTRAWREHLGLTQIQLAERLGVSQSSYAQEEASCTLDKPSREKIAAALGIDAELLDL